VTGFRAKYEDIKAQNAEIIEVSVDSVATQKAWAESIGGVPFPIVADFHPKAAVAQAYGVYNEERGNAFRSVFLIDEQGVIRHSEVFQAGTRPEGVTIEEQLKSL